MCVNVWLVYGLMRVVLPKAMEAGKRACTVSQEASALQASSPPLLPIAAATAGSDLRLGLICRHHNLHCRNLYRLP